MTYTIEQQKDSSYKLTIKTTFGFKRTEVIRCETIKKATDYIEEKENTLYLQSFYRGEVKSET